MLVTATNNKLNIGWPISTTNGWRRILIYAFSKPMNKFLYLSPTSCHSQHIFGGWIVGTGRRFRLNYTVDTDFKAITKEFESHTTARGYSEDLFIKLSQQSLTEQLYSTLYGIRLITKHLP